MTKDPPDPGTTVTELIDEVFRYHGAVLGRGDALAAAEGLTAARLQILGHLAGGPATAAELAHRHGLRRQTVQEAATHLIAEGFVVRAANPDDRRAPLLRITPTARARLAELEPGRAAWARVHGSVVDVDDLVVTLRTLRRLRAALDDTAPNQPA